MKVDLQEFFKLPLEEKNAYARLPNGMEGYGQPYIFGQGRKLDWGDMFMLGSLPASQRNMKFWPENPSSFRATLDKYSLELQKVSTCLVKLMAKNLGNNPKHLTDMFENGRQAMPLDSPYFFKSMKCKVYKSKEIPGAFIVNIGDIIEVMSNGEYKSVEHKTVLNPEHERFSIAAFHFPNVKAMIGPLQDLVKENGAVYKTLSNDEFLGLFQKAKLDDGTGYGHGLEEKLKRNREIRKGETGRRKGVWWIFLGEPSWRGSSLGKTGTVSVGLQRAHPWPLKE
ncbi:S-norcoclaurine synthase 1 [Vitis vinifera]|uniref:S-norcoclaurine synthase 1 n=1 Tax=Vitis vinifera TaxID=29760 RepID=A0A438IU43_VITVI|nr:S-norcoclaurine synthase 1 [Vitis vinifera]